jgi:PTS system N-acetylglucosamine-specific IIC component
VGGLLLSIALTSFLTGVTEPIEFTFMFLAPVLYAVHAVLTGLAMVIMHALGVHLGFSFSAGLFDYLLNFSLATRPLWLLPIGAVYFALYYTLFRYGIVRFNLATPGRGGSEESDAAGSVTSADVPRAVAMIQALGGASNLTSVDACTTRLRLTVVDGKRVNAAALAKLGAMGVVRPAPTAVQVVLGPIADQVAGEIRTQLRGGTGAMGSDPTTAIAGSAPVSFPALLAALGGASNVAAVEERAGRVIVRLDQPALLDASALDDLVVRGAVLTPTGALHLLLGAQGASVAAELRNASRTAPPR